MRPPRAEPHRSGLVAGHRQLHRLSPFVHPREGRSREADHCSCACVVVRVVVVAFLGDAATRIVHIAPPTRTAPHVGRATYRPAGSRILCPWCWPNHEQHAIGERGHHAGVVLWRAPAACRARSMSTSRHHRARHAAGARHRGRLHRRLAHRWRAARGPGRHHGQNAAQRAYQQLSNVGARVVGTVLNDPGGKSPRKATTTTRTTTPRRSSDPLPVIARGRSRRGRVRCSSSARPATRPLDAVAARGPAYRGAPAYRAPRIEPEGGHQTRMSSTIARSGAAHRRQPAGRAADEHRDRRPRGPRQEHGHRPAAGRHPFAARRQAGSGPEPCELNSSRSSTPSCSTLSRTSRPRASPSTRPGSSSRATCATTSSSTRPGHIEFLKNMITGAARAEAALLVIDAAEGVQENSRRHGYMMSMLGIRQLAVVVNKMDLVGWDRGVYDGSSGSTARSSTDRPQAAAFIPVSARGGDNIARSEAALVRGPTVLNALDEFRSEPTPSIGRSGCRSRTSTSSPSRATTGASSRARSTPAP